MQVYTNGTDTVVAESIDDVRAVVEAQYGCTMESEGWSLDEWHRVKDDKPITITNYDDQGNKLTLTAAEWAARDGRGLLCSTEW